MRILEVSEASASGTFEVLRTIASGAAASGHDVCVALGRRPQTPNDVASLFGDGVDVRLLPWTSRKVPEQIRAAQKLRALVRSWQPDVVHLHSAFAGVVGTAAVPRDIPIVYTPHGSPTARAAVSAFGRVAYRTLESVVVRRATVVGAVSQWEAEVVRERLGSRRVRVVLNGIAELDPDRLPTVVAKQEPPLVVAGGRIDAQRRPEETASILRGVTDVADVRWIGGAAGHEDRPVRDAGIAITGWLPRDAAMAHLAPATVYLHWSASDGLSLAILEAMARDVVVVASDIAANRDVVGERQVASDVRSGIELVRRVLVDPTLRDELIADQRVRRGRYAASANVAGWLEVYRDCLTAQA